MDQETYSEIILELYKHPMNEGKIENADLTAQGGNPLCGDAVRLDIVFEGNRVKEIMFSGEGCAISQASASLLTDIVKGKTMEEIQALKPENVFEYLGNIVQTRIKCALLPLHVLKEGLREYRKKEEKPLVVQGIKI